MSFQKVAAQAARALSLAIVVAFAGGLTACGGSGGVSSTLPLGDPTTAAPGNKVLYVAMAQGNRIDAYRLGADGLLPSKPFSSLHVTYPQRLTVAGNVLYATLFDRIISVQLGANGTLPNVPSSQSVVQSNYDPIDLEVRGGVLYVAASGIGFVQSFQLDANGDLPADASASGRATTPADFVSLALNGPYLYAGSRLSSTIEVFLLDADGNVPKNAEPELPTNFVALPDAMVIRNNILYVTSAGDRSVRAYKIEPNGFLAGIEDSHTKPDQYYSDILIDGDTLYTTDYNVGRIDLFPINADGMFSQVPPIASTQSDPSSYPTKMLLNAGILYVAQGGLDRVDAYVLDGSGKPPIYPTSSTTPAPGDSYPLDLVLYQIP